MELLAGMEWNRWPGSSGIRTYHGRALEKELQEQAKTLFEGKRGPAPVAAHREPELLYSEIGKLKVELDWLKKKSGISR